MSPGPIETGGRRCYIGAMATGRTNILPRGRARGVEAHSTIAFAAIGDHARLPWRFFARLLASDGSLLR